MLSTVLLDQVSLSLVINLAAITFALALFLLSLYSWWRRRHRTLLLFAGAFLAFLLEELLEVAIGRSAGLPDYVAPGLTLAALVLFFVGLLSGSGAGWRT